MDKIMKMNSRKRQLVTHTIAESSRIQTKKFFVRENIKKQLLKEREEVSIHPLILFLVLTSFNLASLCILRNCLTKERVEIESSRTRILLVPSILVANSRTRRKASLIKLGVPVTSVNKQSRSSGPSLPQIAATIECS